MTLIDDCKALADELETGDVLANNDYAEGMDDQRQLSASDLRAIIAKHEPAEWRGPVRCNECGLIFDTRHERHENWVGVDCLGTLVPYERRGGGE